MLHENSDADEKISVDNELYMSSENLLFVDETLRYGIKEFHRNPETTPREQTKREINATERKPALLREHDKQVTDTSNDDELYVNISSTLETDAEIYEDHILQETNTEIPFPESQLKMSKTDLKTSNQKLEHEVKVEYSDATFQYKILNKTLSQRNEYEASVNDKEFVDGSVQDDPEGIMIESKKYTTKSQKKDFINPHSCNYPENTSFISNKSYLDEEGEDDYAELEDMKNENKDYFSESQKEDFLDPHLGIDPENIPYTLNPSCIDEEFVDNCIYGNPEEIMCKSKDYSQESQKKDFADPPSVIDPQNTPTAYTLNPSCIDEEFVDNCIYGNPEEIMCKSKDYSQESQKKDFADPPSVIDPQNTPTAYTLNPSCIDEEFVDNCIYGNPEEIMCKSKDYSQESQKKDFADPPSVIDPQNTPTAYTLNPSCIDEEFVDNCIYGNPEEIMCKSKDYSQEAQKKDFVDPHSVIDPQNTPYTLNPSCIDEEFVDNCIYGNPEEIMCKSKDYSQEAQKKDFVDPHSVIDPQNTPYKLNPSCIDEEFVDNCIYGNPEEIMCKSKDYSQEFQKEDFRDPYSCNFSENTSFISNKSYSDGEIGEDDSIYADLEDIRNESKGYSQESQKKDFVDPHSVIDPQNTPYNLNPSCIDEEFVDNCIYGNPEEIMCKSKDYSQESQKKDFWDPHSCNYPENTSFISNKSYLDEEEGEDDYAELEDMKNENKDYSSESQIKDFVYPHLGINPGNTPYTLNPSGIDEEFVDNCIYGNPEEIMCKSKDYSQESQKKDFWDPHSCNYPENTSFISNKSYLDEEEGEDDYAELEDMKNENKDYSSESQIKDFVYPHLGINPGNTPYTLNPSGIDEEFVDNCIYGNPEEIMCKSKDYSQESQKKDFWDPHSCNYPENTSFISNKSYLDEEEGEDDYAELEDMKNENKDYSQESQKKDFADPPSVIDPQNTPYTLNPSCIDEEFVDNCIYGNPEEIMCKSKDYSQESRKKDFVDPIPSNY